MVIDTSTQRNRGGELYYPSHRWGVQVRDEHAQPTNGSPLLSTTCPTKAGALVVAQECCSRPGRSASVYRRADGRVAMRYWRDAEGLQYIEY